MGKQKGDSYKTEFYLPGKIIFFYFAILHKDREEKEREKEREKQRQGRQGDRERKRERQTDRQTGKGRINEMIKKNSHN